MKKDFDTLYKNVPSDQREHFKKFRSTHPYKTVYINDITWEYISCGHGTPLVLLPGGGFRLGETWYPLITALEKNYRIISPTYPAVPTMAQRVEGVFTILQSEKIDKIHILGWSLGGWIAQCFARKHLDTVKSLILSNTSGPQGMSKKHLRIAPYLISAYPRKVLQVGIKKVLLSLFSIPDSEREFWEAFSRDISFKTKKEDTISERKCMLDFLDNYTFTQHDLGSWPGKILILESDNDSVFGKSAKTDLKALYPAAQVHTFYHAGHAPMYGTPTEFISVVETFLSEYPSNGV
ncbi:MAG: alpha/beta hydrolase [Candidatus Methanofastidiosia archaeon]|jgi:pimeloyl-ACP methyl ester carboxylesterase